MMKIKKTSLNDCLVIEPEIFNDTRGFFLETFNVKKYQTYAGIEYNFVQDNYSRSQKGVLRGLHFQKTKPQGKLVWVEKGEAFDVAIDIRKNSSTYGKWHSLILSEENKKQFWIPPGFAHGFIALSEVVDFKYKCTEYYDPNDEGSIIWNDPTLNIDWPDIKPSLSSKDMAAKKFIEIDI